MWTLGNLTLRDSGLSTPPWPTPELSLSGKTSRRWSSPSRWNRSRAADRISTRTEWWTPGTIPSLQSIAPGGGSEVHEASGELKAQVEGKAALQWAWGREESWEIPWQHFPNFRNVPQVIKSNPQDVFNICIKCKIWSQTNTKIFDHSTWSDSINVQHIGRCVSEIMVVRPKSLTHQSLVRESSVSSIPLSRRQPSIFNSWITSSGFNWIMSLIFIKVQKGDATKCNGYTGINMILSLTTVLNRCLGLFLFSSIKNMRNVLWRAHIYRISSCLSRHGRIPALW